MAEVQTGGGGRRTNIELNLVPFIDLMSVLITFLLITAVWTQVSMVQIGTSIYGKKTEGEDITPAPDTDVVLKLDILNYGYVLTAGTRKMSIAKKNNEYDRETLMEQLKVFREKYPRKLDAVISMSDDMAYNHLITGMDYLLEAGFSQLSVATGGS